MIKNAEQLKKFENNYLKGSRLSFKQSIKIFTDLWNEALNLGVISNSNPLEGIETDIKIAKVLNSCLKSSCLK
jgi:hypothetical protein